MDDEGGSVAIGRPGSLEAGGAASTGPTAPGLELEVLAGQGAISALEGAWRELVEAAAATPFEHPAWLLAWLEAYGEPGEPRVLAWRQGPELVGVVPLLVVPGATPLRGLDLVLWGGRGPLLRGFVDLVARPEVRPAVEASFAAWLGGGEPDWRLLHVLRLPPGSSTASLLRRTAAARGWRAVELTGVVHSTTYVIDLPSDADGWQRFLGPKARHNMRREVRLFGKRRGGRYERWVDPAATDEVVDALRRFMGERWGVAEGYFRADPRFDGFLRTALRGMLGAGAAYVDVAVEPAGLAGVLVTFVVGRAAAAVLIGLRSDPELAPLSIGKNLFDASIAEAVARGAATYDFLWVGGYKEAFWHATPRRTTSLVVGRGRLGRLLGRAVELRRVSLPRLLGRGSGGSVPAEAPGDRDR
jgi:CelD/BcsL family acetyltransferase involved in cellulose biosynthesis